MTRATATHTLEVPGAVITYDVWGDSVRTGPYLLLIGSPMGASGFGTLASHCADRTVVTYDPRGVERSRLAGGASECTPAQHADDLHRLITELSSEPVELFASSGGAVNALALVTGHPEQVTTLVAHEPPAIHLLPDREWALRVSRDIHETYLRSGRGPAMAKFIALVNFRGELPDDYLDRPAPDPARFGLPAEDDGSRDDPLLANLIGSSHYEFDLDALRSASTRIVIGVGAESEGQLARRAGAALAERLGAPPVIFPGGHTGFMGGEHGQPGDPAEFAAKLREVLAK